MSINVSKAFLRKISDERKDEVVLIYSWEPLKTPILKSLIF